MEFNKHAYVLEIVGALSRHNGWCGKTQVQKSLYLANDLAKLQVPFQFVLYKHGPYSFEVEYATEEMKSYDAIKIQPFGGYGVTISSSENAEYVRTKSELSAEDKAIIDILCNWIAPMGVAQLEKTATSVWVRRREGISDTSVVANRVQELKPHISADEALAADEEARTWERRALSVCP